jgi:hypothetical protein
LKLRAQQIIDNAMRMGRAGERPGDINHMNKILRLQIDIISRKAKTRAMNVTSEILNMRGLEINLDAGQDKASVSAARGT